MKKSKIPMREIVEILKGNGCTYDPVNGGIVSKTGKRKGHVCVNGYNVVVIQKDKVKYYTEEQRCVWWWFNPDTDDNMVIDHKNNIRNDNRIENLQAVTHKQNMRFAKERGRLNPPRGEKSGKTKITNTEAATIKYLAQTGMRRKDIAEFIVKDKAKYPIVTVNRIINGERFENAIPQDIWSVYPLLVERTARTDLPINEQICNSLLGISGEAGEVIDLVKKHLFQGADLDKDKLIEELGDLMFYITWFSVLTMGLDRAEIMWRNADKLRKRYPEGFDEERSVNREDNKCAD